MNPCAYLVKVDGFAPYCNNRYSVWHFSKVDPLTACAKCVCYKPKSEIEPAKRAEKS